MDARRERFVVRSSRKSSKRREVASNGSGKSYCLGNDNGSAKGGKGMVNFWRKSLFIVTIVLGMILQGGQVVQAEPAAPAQAGVAVPDWVWEEFRAEFGKAGVKRENIGVLVINMTGGEQPQVAAWTTLGRMEGLFVLYEYRNGTYVKVYEKRSAVWNVGDYGRELVLTFSAGSGTGYQKNTIHVLRHTPKGFKVVWNGDGSYYNSMGGGADPSMGFDASVVTNGVWLHHTRNVRAFGGFDELKKKRAERPFVEKSVTDVYKYNEKTFQYEWESQM